MTRDQASETVTHLFDTWYPAVVRYGYRACGSREAAEEFAQEAFTAFYRNLRADVDILNPRAWMLRTVRNQAGKYWRTRQRHAEQLTSNTDLDLLVCAEWSSGYGQTCPLHLSDFLDSLTDREEQAIVMRSRGLKYREIARRMGITTNSVGTLVLRATRKIRKAKVDQSGPAPQAGAV